MSKTIGVVVLALFALVAIGSVLAPFAAVVYVIATNSLSDIIRYALIGYVCMIPISMFAHARKG